MAKRKKKKAKSKSLGQGFLRHLRILETCERAAIRMSKLGTGKESHQFYLDDLGDPIARVFHAMGSDPNAAQFVQAVVERWANDAADLRESFKFQTKDMGLLVGGPYPEVELIMPFEKTTLVVHVENPMSDNEKVDLVFYVELRTTPEKYLDIEANDPFYSVTTSIYKPDSHYGGVFPFELHLPHGQIIPADGEKIMRDMTAYLGAPEMIPESMMEEMYKVQLLSQLHVCRFVQVLAMHDVKKTVVPGLKPGITHVARKRKYPMYEHTTVEIELTPEQQAEPKFSIEGRHHRLHPVRGHWRHYKSGKKTWIKEHWRGDDALGVVTHDYELTDDDPEG